LSPENRIGELDLARGLCILGMIGVHLVYDLTEIYPLFPVYPPLFLFLKNWGGTAFFLLSGISATLGSHPLRRGSQVLLCAAAVSAVTSLAGSPIRFGVLHCLGACMVLWTALRKLPADALLSLAAVCMVLGAAAARTFVSVPFLYPLGLVRADFYSADYFPLFPFLGFFVAGSCLGRHLYAARRSLFPRLSFSSPAARFLRLCGRNSLFLYLAHQPVLIFLIEAAIFTGGVFREI